MDANVRQSARVRYADDAVVLCRSLEEAPSALARMRSWVTANGLTLHPDKTHLGDCRVDAQGFELLEYRFEAGKRWVRKQSPMSLKNKVRAKTKRNEGNSIECVIASPNPTLRRRFEYFQHAHRYTFSTLDGFIRRRLRTMLRRKKHRPGQGRCLRDHKQWPNTPFEMRGSTRLAGASPLDGNTKGLHMPAGCNGAVIQISEVAPNASKKIANYVYYTRAIGIFTGWNAIARLNS